MNCSWLMLFDKMLKGSFEAFFAGARTLPAVPDRMPGTVREKRSRT